eukprot:1086868-Heterocapsa_arctica.AAC.1
MHTELKETKLKAETHNLASSDDALKEQMRYAHHAAIREMEARREAQPLEERRVAEHAASLARITALAELRKSEAIGEHANQQ